MMMEDFLMICNAHKNVVLLRAIAKTPTNSCDILSMYYPSIADAKIQQRKSKKTCKKGKTEEPRYRE
jgi:hypothetical protein